MVRNAGSRRVSDTGSTTGVATTILALLSAGTVATITLVGVNQLAPAVSHLGSSREPSSLLAPRGVEVTPHSSPSPSSVGGSPGHPSKPRTSSPPDDTVVALPSAPHGVTRVITAVTRVITAVSRIRPPAATPASVDPTRPPATRTLNPPQSPTVRVPTGRAHEPSSGHRARHEHARRSADPTRDDRSARSRRGSSGCRQQDGADHRANHHGGHSDDSGRRSNGHGESGDHRGHGGSVDDRGQCGHGHGGHGGSRHDRHGH